MGKVLRKHLAILLIIVLSLEMWAFAPISKAEEAEEHNQREDAQVEENINNQSMEIATPEEPEKETIQLSLKYDDRYSFSQEILDIINLDIVSKKTGTYVADSAVLTQKAGEKNTVIATGCGGAKVLLADGSICEVKVTAAPISLILLVGQSNAEGNYSLGSKVSEYKNQYILNKEGQVYNTYAPSTSNRGKYIGWYKSSPALTIKNASSFIPDSLADNSSALPYKRTNNLTDGDNALGKGGIDSSLAYRWNAMLKEKIWIINAACTGSSIETWLPGSKETDNNFWKAVNLYKQAEKLLDKEIKAGHYTLSHKGYYWCQGEANVTMSARDYNQNFSKVHNGFMTYLSGSETQNVNKRVEFAGILMNRAAIGSDVSNEDLYMTGPRQALYYMCSSNQPAYSKIYLASDIEEQWVTDEAVKKYFITVFKNLDTYKKYNPMKYKLTAMPSKVSAMHPTVHYTQLAYNEIGRDAARNIIYALGYQKAPTSKATSMKLYQVDGKNGVPSSITLGKNTYMKTIVKIRPVYLSKKLKVTATGGGIYNANGVATSNVKLNSKISFAVGGKSCTVTITPTASGPVIQNCFNSDTGIGITYGAVKDASKYYICRKKINDSKWTVVGTTTKCSYVDKTALSGHVYQYTVRAMNKAGVLSAYDVNGKLVRRLVNTRLKLSSTDKDGINLKWDSVPGTYFYAVFKKTNDKGSFKSVGMIFTNTFTDKDVKKGDTYTYLIRPFSKTNPGRFSKNQLSIRYTPVLSAVPLTKVTSTKGTAKVEYAKVSGATSYIIYRRTSKGKWSQVGTTKSLYYTDKKLKSGNKYYYTVRAVKNGTQGGYDNHGLGVTIK